MLAIISTGGHELTPEAMTYLEAKRERQILNSRGEPIVAFSARKKDKSWLLDFLNVEALTIEKVGLRVSNFGLILVCGLLAMHNPWPIGLAIALSLIYAVRNKRINKSN